VKQVHPPFPIRQHRFTLTCLFLRNSVSFQCCNSSESRRNGSVYTPADLVKMLSNAIPKHVMKLNLLGAQNKRASQCVVMVAREHGTGLRNRLCMRVHERVSLEASDSKYSFNIKIMWKTVIALTPEIHVVSHINPVCTSQETHYVSATKPNRLLLLMKQSPWEPYGTHRYSPYLRGNTLLQSPSD
jgi:hypothetical protein